MGLLDSLKQQAMGVINQVAGQNPQLAQEINNLVHSGPGGLASLVQQFHGAGLGQIVQSWVSTGPNQPINAQQIQQVLGSDRVKQMAAKVGLDPNVVSQKLSAMLPQIIDGLTPHGQLPTATPPAPAR